MPRRDRNEDPAPPRDDRDRREKRSRLESVMPDLLKKVVNAGVDRAHDGAETIKGFISESKLPKEIAGAILQQMDDTKNGLFRVVAKEIRGFLEAVDFQRELQKLLTTVSFEIKTEIRFIPNDTMPDRVGRPQVKADLKVKRQRPKEKDEPSEESPARASMPPPADQAASPPPGAKDALAEDEEPVEDALDEAPPPSDRSR